MTSAPTTPGRTGAATAPAQSVFLSMAPITAAVFIAFLTIGLALPVLPLQVHDALGFSPFVVGLVVGCQFAAALLSRVWAGGHADTRGAKRAMTIGLGFASLAGVVYLASMIAIGRPLLSIVLLTIGRLVLGCGESFIATGALSWGVGLVGPQNAGKVMAWVGMAMYGAYATGAPAGAALYRHSGFGAIGLATLLVPLLALVVILPTPGVAAPTARRAPFYRVLGAVWLPGLGLALASVGFGAITTFIALQFAAQGWGGASLAFTSFGAAFIVARVFFGGLPDRLGGARVALVCVVIEAAGQALIWQAPSVVFACLGAALTGFGYSLAFPGFGVEAVRRSPIESRGLAMGAYVAFMDLALGIAGPSLGLVADQRGVGAVYLASAAVVACALVIAAILLVTARPRQGAR